jgi:hypothetical protein
MARPRSKNSTYPLGGLGLKPEEDQKLFKLVEQYDISVKQLCRALVRQWIANGGNGILQQSKK